MVTAVLDRQVAIHKIMPFKPGVVIGFPDPLYCQEPDIIRFPVIRKRDRHELIRCDKFCHLPAERLQNEGSKADPMLQVLVQR